MTKDYKAAFDLIKENTEEIVNEEELLTLLQSDKEVKAYWGTAPTGKVHIGYLIPMSKRADFLNVGVTFKV